MRYIHICGELHRQGYLTNEEYKKDLSYASKTYSLTLRKIYCVLISPVVLLMRLSPCFTKCIWWLSKKIWFKHALK